MSYNKRTNESVEFDFSNLKPLYDQAMNSPDGSLAFNINNGHGKFLFMMFLSDEDEESKDLLYIYMRNTRKIIKLKLYGSHYLGNFKAYISKSKVDDFVKELQLTTHDSSFNFMNFLNELHSSFPDELNFSSKMQTIRDNRDIISSLNAFDEAKKTILVGLVHLDSNKHPRDKTLRKLYAYTCASAEDIESLILLLKQSNITLRWEMPGTHNTSADVTNLLNELKHSKQSI